MYGYTVFHKDLIQPLIQAVHHGTHTHAYIFNGAEGMFRHETARLFAAALTCNSPSSAPCGHCPSCVQAKAGSNPDIIYIDSGDKKTIGAEPIRHLADQVYIKPFGAGHKVYIIEADLMTEQAQNAFLKTLEEPPSYAVFILLTTDHTRLLETIRSRSTLIQFHPISSAEIESYLKNKYDSDQAGFMASLSEGNPGLAEQMLNDEHYLSFRQEAAQNLKYLLSSYPLSIYNAAEYFEQNKDSAENILKIWLSLLRDIMMLLQGCNDRIINRDLEKLLSQYAGRTDLRIVMKAIEEIVHASEMSKRYVNIRALCMGLCIRVKQTIRRHQDTPF